jgi:hypothetical protein
VRSKSLAAHAGLSIDHGVKKDIANDKANNENIRSRILLPLLAHYLSYPSRWPFNLFNKLGLTFLGKPSLPKAYKFGQIVASAMFYPDDRCILLWSHAGKQLVALIEVFASIFIICSNLSWSAPMELF